MDATLPKPRVVIAGAGPAGLTAAVQLLRASDAYEVVVLEADGQVGGLSKTLLHHGNRLDIGGHRFFSRSAWVMKWWQEILPLAAPMKAEITYHQRSRPVESRLEPSDPERVMLLRPRLSRIYHAGKFFAYPIRADFTTARQLGLGQVVRILASYLKAQLRHRQPEKTLEDFIINHFGRVLYETFFKDYTEKVWGVPCAAIAADWGAQRIKGLSIGRAILHALWPRARGIPTSLIEQFLYPKYGPGQLWQAVAEEICQRGGVIRLETRVVGIIRDGQRIKAVRVCSGAGEGEGEYLELDHLFSTLPVQDLIAGLSPAAPPPVQAVAQGLQYRDFITVGVLLTRLLQPVPDTWIYIQDKGVKVGRIQFFHNWSPAMVADPATVWLGMEYFCQQGDDLWRLTDDDLLALALAELAQLKLADPADRLDGVVLRVPKAYPGYFGSYGDFATLREWTDSVGNLYLIGRNGMHRYNNQDHSMLTAKRAVEALLTDNPDRSALWAVNLDDDYHEG